MRRKNGKSKNPIKGISTLPIWKRKVLVETVTSVPPIIGAVVGIFARPQGTDVLLWLLVLGAAWLTVGSVLKILKAHDEDQKTLHDQSHTGITACLHVLHAIIEDQGKIEFNKADATAFDLRVTFHRVIEPLDDSKELEQLVDYVGGDGGGEGRRMNIRCGITGQAVRVNDVFVMDRDVEDVDSYRQILVSEWHYTRSEASKLKADRFSAIAVPITSETDKDLVLGVVYMDTKMQNFFNRARLQECAVNSCAGMSRYIGERYDK